MKPKITPNCDATSDTGDTIDEIPSFSLGIIKRDNVVGDDCNDYVEDNELYVQVDHFERILVEKSSKKNKKYKGICLFIFTYMLYNSLHINFLSIYSSLLFFLLFLTFIFY